MAEWVEGTVAGNARWTPALFSLTIDAAVDGYAAGQFTSLALDLDGERIARPYSHLSPPGRRPLEYFLYTATGGRLSNALARLGAGDRVWVKKRSNGFFVLDEVPDCEELWMLATGTGVAPFLSILGTETPWRRFRRVVLAYAARTGADLCYRELIDALLERRGEALSFHPFVSRERVPGALRGRIPAAIEDGRLEAAAGLALSPERSHCMLCGNPGMVRDAAAALKERGLARNRRRTPGQITVENYW